MINKGDDMTIIPIPVKSTQLNQKHTNFTIIMNTYAQGKELTCNELALLGLICSRAGIKRGGACTETLENMGGRLLINRVTLS